MQAVTPVLLLEHASAALGFARAMHGARPTPETEETLARAEDLVRVAARLVATFSESEAFP